MDPLPLAASAEAGSSMIKRMMRLRFFSLQRAQGVFRMHCGRGQFQQSCCVALHRLAPPGRLLVEPAPQRTSDMFRQRQRPKSRQVNQH
jgi:hypothetical protein